MDLSEWWPWYSKIISTFRFDRSEDQRSADILSNLLKGRGLEPSDVRRLIEYKPVIVFGAGPSLKNDLMRLSKFDLLSSCVVISADGATTALLSIDKIPNIVVSDLDGRISDLIEANRRGAYMVIHAHGDNIPAIEKYVPMLDRVLGTTQAEPRPHVYNFGGFTDGDRAVFLAVEFDAKVIGLAGMDLGNEIGEYSKPIVKSYEIKLMKLKFCKELLEWLSSKTDIPLYNLTSNGEVIKGFRNVTPSEFLQEIEG
ncbi:MAG: DUF115 domain-containing protein [Nitrososphaerota archaeon]|nr:DUF115 domain-containing protein [Nitrososphaerales archaeon]MDW8044707.1 DUF115 domain-containing protein [Nitrososphaerota archaeon]